MDQPEKVNMTAEEEIDDDDEDMQDFKNLRLNTENAHLFMDHAKGTVESGVVKIEHGSL